MDIVILILGMALLIISSLRIYFTVKMSKIKLKKIAEIDFNNEERNVIYGTVLPDKTILSAISQTPCVYCFFQTFQRGMKQNKKLTHGTAQNILGSGTIKTNFFLKDDTVKLELNPEKAIVFNHPNQKQYHETDEEMKDKITQFKLKYGISSAPDIEYWEETINPNDKIYVMCRTIPKETPRAQGIYLEDPRKIVKRPSHNAMTIILLIMGCALTYIALTGKVIL